jgi:hypothetical protein
MKRWPKSTDLDFTSIDGTEIEWACLYEMIRQLSPDQRSAIGISRISETVRCLSDSIVWKSAWSELTEADRLFFCVCFKQDPIHVRTSKTEEMFHQILGTVRPSNADVRLFKTESIELIAAQIDWRAGMTAIKDALNNWLDANAPAGTPGTGSNPDPNETRRGPGEIKQFRSILDWISILRRKQNEESIESIRRSIGSYDSSKVRKVEKNLKQKYRQLLGFSEDPVL